MQIKANVIFFGPKKSGKTKLIHSILSNPYNTNYQTTHEVDFFQKDNFYLWDTSNFMKDEIIKMTSIKAKIGVYCIAPPNKRAPWDHKMYCHDINNFIKRSNKNRLILVITQADRPENTPEFKQKVTDLANELGIPIENIIETSAFNRQNTKTLMSRFDTLPTEDEKTKLFYEHIQQLKIICTDYRNHLLAEQNKEKRRTLSSKIKTPAHGKLTILYELLKTLDEGNLDDFRTLFNEKKQIIGHARNFDALKFLRSISYVLSKIPFIGSFFKSNGKKFTDKVDDFQKLNP